MDRILLHYPFLLNLCTSTKQQQLSILSSASVEQVQAILDCVKLYNKTFPNKINIKTTNRINRAVLILKRNRHHLKPVLLGILLCLLRECLHYVLLQQ